jgi:hypothetical protein
MALRDRGFHHAMPTGSLKPTRPPAGPSPVFLSVLWLYPNAAAAQTRLRVGTFNPKPENRTKPNRNRIELSVFWFFGSASVFIIGRFGCRFGDRFCLPTEPKNRTDRITGAPSNPSILSSCATARLCSLSFPTVARGPVGFNDHGTKAHHAMPIVSSLKKQASLSDSERRVDEHRGRACDCASSERGTVAPQPRV